MADLSSSAAGELVAAIREDNADLQAQLASERDRADRMAAALGLGLVRRLTPEEAMSAWDTLNEHGAARG